MEIDDSTQQLRALCERIPELTFEIRGSDKARFIYARTKLRAVEISPDLAGFLFEGWSEANEESDAAPSVTLHLATLDEVERVLRSWLA